MTLRHGWSRPWFGGASGSACIRSTCFWHNTPDIITINDVIMTSQFTSLTIVCSSVYSGADQRKHQNSASPAIVRGIHRWPVNSPHKGPVTRKIFPFDDVIISCRADPAYIGTFLIRTSLIPTAEAQRNIGGGRCTGTKMRQAHLQPWHRWLSAKMTQWPILQLKKFNPSLAKSHWISMAV